MLVPAGALLDALVCDGARRMLASALQAEVGVYIEQHEDPGPPAERRVEGARAGTNDSVSR